MSCSVGGEVAGDACPWSACPLFGEWGWFVRGGYESLLVR